MLFCCPVWAGMEAKAMNGHGRNTAVHKEHPKEPLTEDVVELLTTPLDLAGYKTAITEALYKGTKRNVESEKDAKNAQVG